MVAIAMAGGPASRLRGHIGHLPKCLVPFDGKPYLWWLCRYLDAYGVHERVIAANRAHRVAFADDISELGELLYFAGFPGDPLPHLVEALPAVDAASLVLLINANMLPPPGLDPRYLAIVDDAVAATVALAPAVPSSRTIFHTSKDGARVTSVTGGPAAPGSAVRCYLGVSVIAPAAVTAAMLEDYPPRTMAEMFSRWARHGQLGARSYEVLPVRFSTPAELRSARREFARWRADLDEQAPRQETAAL